jgi:hypothetical protein
MLRQETRGTFWDEENVLHCSLCGYYTKFNVYDYICIKYYLKKYFTIWVEMQVLEKSTIEV